MAKVYYVKDGSYPQNFVDLGRRVPLDELERRMQGRDLRYLSTMPPECTPAQPSHAARYVVVEREMDEPPGHLLTHTGYYPVPELSRTRRRPHSSRRRHETPEAAPLGRGEPLQVFTTGLCSRVTSSRLCR
jgi:hypothetical protein